MATSKKKSKLVKAMNEEWLGSEKFIPTLEDCNHWFRIINKEIFDGEITVKFDEIEIRRRHGLWGECIGYTGEDGEQSYTLSLHNSLKSKQHFIQVIAHEMVHLWEYSVHGTMSHGVLFHGWRDKFEKYGLILTGGNT